MLWIFYKMEDKISIKEVPGSQLGEVVHKGQYGKTFFPKPCYISLEGYISVYSFKHA